METKKLKVFIIAFACEPYKGSEVGIGWNVVNKLTAYHDVHVLTRANNRKTIEEFYAKNNWTQPTFYYYDLPRSLRFWKKGARGYRLYYYLWLYFSYFHYRNLAKKGNFDIIHHLTFAQESTPNLFIANNHSGAKTIWGPVGSCCVPEFIRKKMPLKIKLIEFLRFFSKKVLSNLDIMRIKTEKNADLIISYPQAKEDIPFHKKRRGQLICYPQTGINVDDPEYNLPEKKYPERGTKVLISSVFWHWKGCTFAAEAFARLAKRNPDVTLTILGSGPEYANMKKIFANYQVSDRVKFMGFVSKQQMMLFFHSFDVLLYPSYHHGLATGILQAMWAKLPIVSMKGDFVASAVAEGAGLCAYGNTLDEAIDDIAAKAELILNDRELRVKLGECGHSLVTNKYSWDIMVAGLDKIYQQLVSGESFDEYQDYSRK